MVGTHNFKVFDANNSNMTTDTDYNADAARLSGVVTGKADPLSANKAWHQATIMAAAIAQYMANQGVSSDDTNLLNLVSALAGSFATPGGTSYADRIAHALQAAADIGQISFCQPQPAPAAATYTASGTGNLNGAYIYREVLISGYVNLDGSRFVRGFSPAVSRSSADVSPASQQVIITNLSLGTSGCIGRIIYRSMAGGAAGSEQYCGIIWDNATTTYTDNLVDSQLGIGMPAVQGTAIPADVPTSNTTGTKTSTLIPAMLTAVDWDGDEAPYMQTITAAGLKAEPAPTEFLMGDGFSKDQLEAEQAANIQKGDQADGSITLYAYGDKPTIDIPIKFLVRSDL